MENKELRLQHDTIIKAVERSKEKENVLVIKGIASMYRTPDGFLQTDRDNELINLDFMDLDSYKKNPVLVFQHDWQKGVGKITEIVHKNGALHVTAEVHRLTNLEHIYEAVEKGIIKSLSIGVVPHEVLYRDVNGSDILEVSRSTLVEISLTTVQSNQEALFDVVAKKSPTISKKLLASQNGMTCDELTGSCAFKAIAKAVDQPQEKENTMAEEAKPQNETTTSVAGEDQTVESKEKADETVAEVKSEPKAAKQEFDEEAFARAIVEAQRKTEELAKEKAEREKREAEEAARQKIAEQEAFIASVKAYIAEQKEAIVATPDDEFDTDKVEDFYEMVSNAAEAIEAKVSSIIKGQLDAAKDDVA